MFKFSLVIAMAGLTMNTQLTTDYLQTTMTEWLTAEPKTLELNAALKDFRGICQLAPENPGNISTTGSNNFERLLPLTQAVSELKDFFLHKLIPNTARCLRIICPIISPYMGGVQENEYTQLTHETQHVRQIKVATFNPGRTGLCSLAAEEVLWWRLWRIVAHLMENDIQICVLPGARWPPGATLPPGLPFSWLGVQTTSWAAVGVLVATELQDQTWVIDDLGSDIIMWVAVNSDGADLAGPALIIGAIYPAPGGDLATWQQIINEHLTLRERYRNARIIIAGDGNVHLSDVLKHDLGCRCLHCRQGRNDRTIEQLLKDAGLAAFNPAVKTHVSGTAIDLLIGMLHEPFPVTVCPDDIGLSDHSLVAGRPEVRLEISFKTSLGRVCWAHGDEWDTVLDKAAPLLRQAVRAVQSATEEIQSSEAIPVKRRRLILDSAAWVRDAIYCVLGHCGCLVKMCGKPPAHLQNNRVWPSAVPKPSDYTSYEVYKAAMAKFNIGIKTTTLDKFLQLRACDKGQASRFLSSLFNKSKAFEIALTDEDTGDILSIDQSLESLAQDLEQRGAGPPAENRCGKDLKMALKAIRIAEAPAAGLPGLPQLPTVTTAHHPGDYSLPELEDVLRSVQNRKQCTHGPYAALKSECLAGRILTLALMNLGRACRLTSSMWSSRLISPLRKAGPRIVRKLINLRPISQASDMAAVQDGLWLGRCKMCLEKFTGYSQLGGKLDTMAIIIAVVLHVQIRMFQGLTTYLLFADLKSAFDMADQRGMLVSCYLAGIVQIEWLLLDDFFRNDTAVISLGGVLSSALHLRAGTPQGRRFSVHVFTALLTLLKDVLSSTCNPAQTVLPPFAADAIGGLWTHLTPFPFGAQWPAVVTADSAALAIARALRDDPTEARRMAIHLLAQLPTVGLKSQCMESLGQYPLGPLLFVDDLVAAFATDEEVAKAVNIALPQYADAVGALFNYGPTKTAVMPCFDAPDVSVKDLLCNMYKLLGVQLDRQFTMGQKVDHITRVGKALFQELALMADQAGLPPPLLAAAVVERVEPTVMYACEILVLEPSAISKLNTLQAGWAKSILGATCATD